MRKETGIFQNIDLWLVGMYIVLVTMGWLNVYASVFNEQHYLRGTNIPGSLLLKGPRPYHEGKDLGGVGSRPGVWRAEGEDHVRDRRFAQGLRQITVHA